MVRGAASPVPSGHCQTPEALEWAVDLKPMSQPQIQFRSTCKSELDFRPSSGRLEVVVLAVERYVVECGRRQRGGRFGDGRV